MSERLALALDQQAQAVFDTVRDALGSAAAALERSDGELGTNRETINLVQDIARRHPRMRALVIVDGEGRMVWDSRLDAAPTATVADRDYFIAQRDQRDAGTFIGAPIEGRLSGEWIIPVSRRVPSRDGSFAGVIVETLRLSTFEDFFRSLQLGSHGVVGLIRLDGVVLARDPPSRFIGRSIAGNPAFPQMNSPATGGTFQTVSAIDGIDRIFSYRQIPSLRVSAYVGIATADALAQWYRDLGLQGAIWLLCALFLGSFTVVMVRQLERREAA